MLVNKNEEMNGIEITFDGIPSEETRNALKEKGFRWSRRQKLWWSRFTEEKYKWAQALTDDSEPIEKFTKEVTNDYGVKIGDIFHSSWGYSMSLNSFYRVVKVTKKSVYVVEVNPVRVGFNGWEGHWTLRPDEDWSCVRNEEPSRFVVKLNTWNKKNIPYICPSSSEMAMLLRGDDFKREFYENHLD